MEKYASYCRRTVSAVLLLFMTFAAAAHQGKIAGTVATRGNQTPVPNTLVGIIGSGRLTVTDALGNFSFSGLQEGEYQLTFYRLGYSLDTISVTVTEALPANLNVLLRTTGLELAEVTISGNTQTNLERVTAVDFQLRPVRTTQDLLRMVPGLFIAQHAGGGKAEQIFLRGFDADHGTDVALSVDGLPVNMVSHAHGQGYSDLHWVIPETIEAFNFGKGPYAADQGDFATAGFVSFKTKDAIAQNMVKAEVGNFNTYRGVGLFKFPFKEAAKHKQTGYLAGEYFRSDGPFQASQDFRRYNLFGKYSAFLNANNLLTLTGSYFSSNWYASGQVPQRAVEEGIIDRFGALDPTEGGKTSRINASIQLETQLGNGVSLKNQIYYVKSKFSLFSNFTYFLEDSVNGDGINQRENRDIFGYKGSLTKESHLGKKELTLRGGIGLRYDDIKDLALEKEVRRQLLGEFLSKGTVQQLNAFAWASGTLAITKKLQLMGALRYDAFHFAFQNELPHPAGDPTTATAGRVSPKLTLSYAASKTVQVYANTGIGFHSNDARVSVPQSGREILPAAYGADLGTTVKLGRRVLVQGALWTLKLDQEFVYVGDAGIVEPNGKSLRMGFDFSTRAQITKWLYADLDVNYSHGRLLDAPEGQNNIPLAPNFTSIGGLSAQFGNGFKAAIRYRYLANRPANEDNTVTARGYFVNDFSAGYTYKNMDFGATVENLFNINWNEAQFDTESRLKGEATGTSELHFTPGTPFFIRGYVAVRF
jgi:hypothetical protein